MPRASISTGWGPGFRRKRTIDDPLYEAIDRFAEEVARKVRDAGSIASVSEAVEAAVPVEIKKARGEQAQPKLNPSPVAESRTVDSGKTSSFLTNAIRENPFVNSLGRKFVPVPITGGPTDGQWVLFSIWETRVEDYAAFAKDNPGVNSEWKDVKRKGDKQGPTHPVVNVSWEDAIAFCAWLTEKEREAGLLDSQWKYRLPTDHEWSCAIGIGGKEKAEASPAEKSLKVQDFPRDASGQQWPPPPGAGNYPGTESKFLGVLGRLMSLKIKGYQDAYRFTAPFGSFKGNELGLFDLSGNVWEWCKDWYNNEKQRRVLRGGSWYYGNPEYLRSSARYYDSPDGRDDGCGFRCVAGAVGRLTPRRWHLPHFKDQPDAARPERLYAR